MSAIGNVPLPPCTVTTSSSAREAAPLRERRPRRPLLPLADAEAEAGGLAEHRLRRLAGALAADVAQAQRDRAPDRHRCRGRRRRPCSWRGSRCRDRRGSDRSRCSIGNTLDVVVVSPNAFHSGSESASSAASTNAERGRFDAGQRGVDRDELDRRDAVARAGARTRRGRPGTATPRAAPRPRRRSRAAAGTPSPQCSSSDSSYSARGSAGDLDAFAGERHAVTPSSSSTCG